MVGWSCEIQLDLDFEGKKDTFIIEASISADNYFVPFEEVDVLINRVFGCTNEGDEVELDYVPLDWWPRLKEAVLDEAQSRMELESE